MTSRTGIFLGLLLAFSACKQSSNEPELIIDPVEKVASISVLRTSGGTESAGQLKIDGLYNGAQTLPIASAGGSSAYEYINAGLRQIALGNLQDTVTLKEGNYYTLWVYGQDSVKLHQDASYNQSGFHTLAQLRWTVVDKNPGNYRVDIYADSLLKNIQPDQFIGASAKDDQFRLDLYDRKNGTKLGELSATVKLDEKITFQIRFNGTENSPEFAKILQQTKK